ncbi:MAG: IS1380 family transposase, partial [Phycisphaerae bacterium]|nr:IS1380 family transposase [Phycisphaerae bacterium]NIS53592.1 IS1380 family transposase [Phycisphaerae bacterium]NIX01153.1 IS1380 family transposase [Phycisphaerae bacterium]NIX30808.1 IS1380 family transposase [Phycisphaerae bacterium]
MTVCTTTSIRFSSSKGRKVEGGFNGGDITSDGGVMLLSQMDKQIKLTNHLSKVIVDSRVKKRCDHSLLSLLRQRIYGICLGYEDLNDHDTLRKDIGLQTAVARDTDLASSSTLCRFENRADR